VTSNRSSRRRFAGAPLIGIALVAGAASAAAQIAVSANDGKVRLENGTVRVVKEPVETVSLIDLGATPPAIVGEVKAPTSVAGPPTSVAVSPNEDIALVTAATKIDPADPTKTVPDDTVTVIEIGRTGGVVRNVLNRVQGKGAGTSYAPKVIGTVKVGKGPAGISINRAGTLALVANRSEGTVSVLEIKGKTVTALPEKVKLGDEKSGPSAVAFTPDGRTALVTRDGDNKISVLAIDGTKVTDTGRAMSAGLRPYGLDISAKGDFAVVANIGTGSGDADTVSLIDLTAKPPRIVNTVSVGQTPEGIKIAPDGNWIAISVMNGTNKTKEDPFFADKGKLLILRRNGRDLVRSADADIGRWCQGIAWTSNSRRLGVQCMVEEQVLVFSWNAGRLAPAGSVKTTGGPAGIRTTEK
jgi:DNA-binding beta-propeller fold protein YncE